jgi:DNA-binding XRE family transcriptional regulator
LALSYGAADAAALARFAKRHARGDEATVPVEVIDRIMSGVNPLKVWREHRGQTATQLAAAVAITPAHVSKLEFGKGEPSVALLRRLAKALQVDIELLLGTPS